MSGKSKTLYWYGWKKKSSIFYIVKQLTSFSFAIMCYDWQLATNKHCVLKKEMAHCWVWVGVGGVGEERGTPVTCWQCSVPVLIGGLLPHPPTPTTPHVIQLCVETQWFATEQNTMWEPNLFSMWATRTAGQLTHLLFCLFATFICGNRIYLTQYSGGEITCIHSSGAFFFLTCCRVVLTIYLTVQNRCLV